jgi:hypothetical protein
MLVRRLDHELLDAVAVRCAILKARELAAARALRTP